MLYSPRLILTDFFSFEEIFCEMLKNASDSSSSL
jgi:hypothetical protein